MVHPAQPADEQAREDLTGGAGARTAWGTRLAAHRQGRMRHRLRRQLLPHYAVGGLLLAGEAAHLAGLAAGDPAAVAGLVGASAAGGALVAGTMLRERIPADRKRWAAACAAGGCAWLATAAGAGVTWDTAALLLAGGYALALPHWRRHRIPNPGAVPLADPAAVEDATSIPQLWRANVGALDGPLPGSYLTDRAEIPYGEAYTVQLKPGRQSLATVLSNLTLIGTGLLVYPEDLVVDRHPSGDSSKVLLKVLTRSPIRETVWFTGPAYDPATGTIALGPFADGQGEARWRLYSENSMWGGVLIGGPGSGKSSLIENIAISAASTGYTVILYGDPQEGASSPALARHADWPALGVDQILDMLRALERASRWRAKENAAYGLRGFTPSVERPGVLAIIDECHRVFGIEEARELADWIAREGRKVGIALLVASQYAGLPTFGGSESLRSSIMAGNAVVLRTASKTTRGILAGLEFDPAELPAIPGYAYLIDATGKGRTAPFRARYVADPEGWLERTPQASLDAFFVNALGAVYTERRARAAAAMEVLRAEVEALKAGGAALPTKPETRTTPAPARDHARPAGSGLGAVVAFPAFPAPAGRGRDGAQVTQAQAAVLAAIAAGHTTPAAIRAATGWGETYVRRLLGELLDKGLITKPASGRYALVEQDQATG
ncbi:hypothetical protein TH66_00455 [Carbonactinospora thermoautotrophica]|uniref:FtsK domain-containing protein n=3 Tax=Carbonactinospora thermoautotrophica TaxID=1469144 RepID=A0A132N6V5_9ACTN|nr:type IV secretory system conjugative DNA transfer family protein [Carbonactinospora thermoautotrophica]KWX05848.1 hypothetical protein TH66_00455 [Carbonactinospora thermoautotrophica]